MAETKMTLITIDPTAVINEDLFNAVGKMVYAHVATLANQPTADEKDKLPYLKADILVAHSNIKLAHIESRKDDKSIDVMISFSLV
jgi:hypothetical protein